MKAAISVAQSPLHCSGLLAGILVSIVLSSSGVVRSVSSSFGPSPPSPISPWHTLHISWYSAAPLLLA